MKLTIEIDCGNAAFEDSASTEVANILREYCDKIDGLGRGGIDGLELSLRDHNGNRVGTAKFINQQTPASGMNRDGH